MALRNGCSPIARIVRLAAVAFISASALSLGAGPADAHRYRHLRHVAHYTHAPHRVHYARYGHRSVAAVPSSPAFSAIVVDANSGRTLYSADENGLRHPASITKVMTLYLLFEQLEKGAMTLHTQIPISEHAAAQEPSKLGIDPGDTISVEDAIKAVVTRSANDIAVAIGEAIGHDEDSFAEMMTRKAHELGMSSTVYRNASGLPNDEQVTTARDLTTLARALEERFPREFHYFSTSEFEYAGETIGNHNHLLGRVDGVDGIKTGYTRASGFNLLTSVHRDGRSLIAVVMGGRTAGARDRIMENLIADHIAQASTMRTATMIADASRDEVPAERAIPREAPPVRPHPAVVAANVPSRVPTARGVVAPLAEGDNSADDDDVPTPRVAAFAPAAYVSPAESRPQDRGPIIVASAPASAAPQSPQTPADLGWVKGPDGAAATKERPLVRSPTNGQPPAPPAIRQAANPDPRPAAKLSEGAHSRTNAETTVASTAPTEAGDARGGWMIQIGATDDAAKAGALLLRARDQNRSILAAARPVTERVQKGGDTFYRARFAGLDSASAESACRSLKRNGFSCFPARD